MDEIEVVNDIAHGSEDALSLLYDRYVRIIYSLALAILKDTRDAEEIVQEVFLQVWRRASSFDARRSSVYKWIMTLTRSRAIDKTRAKNFAQHRNLETGLEHLERFNASPPTQLDAVAVLQRAERFKEIFEKIPPEQRDVLRLAYYQGYTQSEIARELDLPLGTVKTRLRQAMIKLQGLLSEEWES